jgi:hypothetical protein
MSLEVYMQIFFILAILANAFEGNVSVFEAGWWLFLDFLYYVEIRNRNEDPCGILFQMIFAGLLVVLIWRHVEV